MSEAYRDLVFETQALRRRVERELRLGGALGVAGTLWPHQVANVARVLSDTSVRHVLADEVGLGKTVQAIMILKALLLQRPELRVAILVPTTLKDQWVREMMVRANLAVVQDEPEEGDHRRPVLLWPSSRRIAMDLGTFDVLVVDELPRLRADLQQRVVAASALVTHLLILTATPPLDDPERARQLFELIEPVRAGLVEAPLMDALRARERDVVELLAADWPEGGSVERPPEPREETAALAFAGARRMLRTRREVWRDYLPYRDKRVRLVEPTAAERRRQELLWRWLAYREELTRDFDVLKMAQRVRSPASLRQRVGFLRGRGHDREGLIEAIGETLERAPGDSRYEGLLDTLLDIWSKDPTEQVLIAAGDNLTVDDLYKRLPAAFDEMTHTGDPLSLVRLRNQTKGPEELFDDDPVAEAARMFQEGEAQVLLLSVAGAAGLNLQCARHIVLYSVPWDPVEVEQLIGRVDRIGNPATESSAGPLPIEVHVIAQVGLVDDRVFRVIEATRILERSISMDGDAVARIRAKIEDVGLRDDPVAWPSLMAEARALGDAREAEDLDLPLLSHLPTAPDRAYSLARRLMDAPALSPMLGKAREGERGWSDAALSWLKALRCAGKYRFTCPDRGAGIRLLAYNLPIHHAGSPGNLDTRSMGLLPELKSKVFLRTHRSVLEPAPPMSRPGEDTPLYFFDHGSPLHEDLVQTWTNVDSRLKQCMIILPEGHACENMAGAVVRIRVGWLDPDRLLPGSPTPHPERDADRRFLGALLPAAMVLAGSVVRPGRVAPLTQAELFALLSPDPRSMLLSKRASPWKMPPWLTDSLLEGADVLALTSMEEQARERWTPHWDRLEQGIASRRYVLSVDATDADDLYVAQRGAREEEAVSAAEEGRRPAETLARRRQEELRAAARARNVLEAERDDWLRELPDRSPVDALVQFNNAWLLLQR